ncbi:Transcription initiation factor TFIID subunit [Tubulinosema ratisbonensis]|uniref:Transcription initiation factor TFIID subunit n=1 Tax=Tubulinosema ratisbonensis TaxID=291195 RepID=A0A437AME8_9MICR|nr:Transcription initiation factor TFIID subunit [Tubulinosema ratisbonensis]
MQKYTVVKQKNIYYVDLDKKIYNGYIETFFEADNRTEFIEYKVSGLDIEEVKLITDTEEEKLFFEITTFDSNKYAEKYDPNFVKDFLSSQIAKVNVNTEKKSFKLKIKYKTNKTNVCINFFEKCDHKEFLAENMNFNSFMIFPNVIYSLCFPFDLFYIVKGGYSVISPGKYKGMVEQKEYNIFSYHLDNALQESINFAVGTFDFLEVVTGDDSKIIYFPMNQNEKNNKIKENVKEIINDILTCTKFLENFINFEFPRFLIVFSNLESLCIGKNTCFISISFLPNLLSSIEQNFTFKEKISYALSYQIFTSFIGSEYIKQGMIGYLSDNCLKYFLGNNEVLFRLKKEKDFIISKDVNELALNDPKRSKFSKLSHFFKIKSKLFIFILENNLSKAFLQKIIFSVLEKIVVYSEDLIKIIKNVTGKEMYNLFEVYVNKPGLVIFVCTFEIEQKKNKVSLQIKQKGTSNMPNSNKRFNGSLCIKAHEIEGVFEHFYNLQKNELVFTYHTRTKKNKKKENDSISLLWLRIDPKNEFLSGIELHQPDFMFLEALINDKNVVSQYESIRALEKRPNEQICSVFERIIYDQHIFYKIRIEAMNSLCQMNFSEYDGYQKIIQFFVKKFCLQGSTIIKPNDFNNFTQYFIQKHLIKSISLCYPYIKKRFNDREIIIRDVCASFINNSLIYNDNESNFYDDSYLLGTAIDSLSLPLCYQEINSKEESSGYEFQFDDSYKELNDFNNFFEEKDYINTISDKECKEISKEQNNFLIINEKHKESLIKSLELIERYRKLDLIFSSPNNIITVNCLLSLGRLLIYGYIKLNQPIIKKYSSKGNTTAVRLVALEILIILKEDIHYLFKLLREDHYLIKLHILTSIKNLISSVITNDYLKYFKEHKRMFYELIPFCSDILLFEQLIEVILFLENKGKEIKKIEEIKLHEFSDEVILKEQEEESELISFKLYESQEKNRKVEVIPLIKVETDPFVDLFIKELSSTPEKKKKIKIKIKKINEYEPKDFLVKVKRHIPKIKKDVFLLNYEQMNNHKLINELINLEGISKIDELILEKRETEEFFEFKPLTFLEISLLPNKDDFTIDYESLINLFTQINLSLLYALTYEKYGSKIYLQIKNIYNNFEKLVYDFLPQKEIILVNKERLNNLLTKLFNKKESNPFIEPVDYKLFKLIKYLDIVRMPLSLSVINNKLKNEGYFNENVFIYELKRVFINCIMFNHNKSEISLDGKICLAEVNNWLEERNGLIYNNENNQSENKINNITLENELKKNYNYNKINQSEFNKVLFTIINEISKLNESKHFFDKIEDLLYKSKIQRQMYLKKIIYKCELKMYVTLGHFINDYKLIKENCINFNGHNSYYTKECKLMEKSVKKYLVNYFGDDCVRVYFGK